MADYGASDTSTTSLGANQFPISETWTPNAGFSALEGGPQSTDLGGKKSAPASMYVKDGGDVAQGTTTDAANASTVVGQLKQIQANTNGGATAVNQTTANTALSSVATNTSNTATNTSNINTATGTKTDTKATDGSVTAWSVIALLKGIIDKLLSTLAVTQSGTWTVQPGNTANTTAWKVDGSGVTQPVSGTVTANAGTNLNTSLLALESGGNLASAKTDLDAVSTVLGATTDVAVVGDNAGTQSAKLRGLSKIWNDVWDSVNHRIHVNVDNGNANGQSTMANSSPVVIASNQTAIPTNASKVSLFSTTQTAQGTGNSGDLDVSKSKVVMIDVNITANPAGTNPTLQFTWNRKGLDGIYYPVWLSDLITGLPANPTKISVSIGPGTNWPEGLGATGQLAWTVGGTVSPTYTFTPSIQGEN